MIAENIKMRISGLYSGIQTLLSISLAGFPSKMKARPNMTEKLFTGTLSIKPNQNKTKAVWKRTKTAIHSGYSLAGNSSKLQDKGL